VQALGMIETKGLLATIEAADVMLKTADVRLICKEKVGGGLSTIFIRGDVAAVKTAVDAGAVAVSLLGADLLYGAHVISRPDEEVGQLLPTPPRPESLPVIEPIVEEEVVEADSIPELIEKLEPVELVEISDNTDGFERISKLKIDKLRAYARKLEGFEISGKELSKMSKNQLLERLKAFLTQVD
jgi:microcompartment protein CcmL/EutN